MRIILKNARSTRNLGLFLAAFVLLAFLGVELQKWNAYCLAQAKLCNQKKVKWKNLSLGLKQLHDIYHASYRKTNDEWQLGQANLSLRQSNAASDISKLYDNDEICWNFKVHLSNQKNYDDKWNP